MSKPLWRECASWLLRCEVLPPGHKVTWDSAKVIDLAYTLRDGVLLCHVLNKLQAGCINLKDISLRPQMAQVSTLIYYSIAVLKFFCHMPVESFLVAK